MANKYLEPAAYQAYQCRVKVALGYQACQSSLLKSLPEPSKGSSEALKGSYGAF